MSLHDVVLVASAATDAPVVAFDVKTGAQCFKHVLPPGTAAGALALVGDEKLLVVAPDKRSLVSFARERENSERASVLSERPSAVCASACGRLVACGSASGTAHAWEATSGRLLARWRAHFKGVSAMAFTPCGSALITGGEDGAVHAWRVSELCDDGEGSGRTNAWRSWTDHALGVSGVACGGVGGAGGDVTVVSCSADRTCKIYSLGSGATLRQVRCPTALTCCALDVCEATLYAGGADGRVFEIPLNGAPSVAVSLDGGADARDGMVALQGHSKRVVGVACSSDGNSLVSASEDGTARVWDVASRQTLHILRHPKAPICDIAIASRTRYGGPGRGGDESSSRKRAKTTAAPTFSKFLIGSSDRSGIKPWQGAPLLISGAPATRRRPSSTPASARSDSAAAPIDDDRRGELAEITAAADAARAEAERWKKLYGDLKSIVDRNLVS